MNEKPDFRTSSRKLFNTNKIPSYQGAFGLFLSKLDQRPITIFFCLALLFKKINGEVENRKIFLIKNDSDQESSGVQFEEKFRFRTLLRTLKPPNREFLVLVNSTVPKTQ